MSETLATVLYPRTDAAGWALRVKTPAGVAVEYLYPSERQARYMAAVFALGPSRLPPAHRLLATRTRRKSGSKRAAELHGVSADEIDSALVGLEG